MENIADFKRAQEILQPVLMPTPLVKSRFFSAASGNEVYLKPENLQMTGAYKIRGAYYKISNMSDADRKKGLVTCSAGNHAQGVAYAAQKLGVQAVVVMPVTTPLVKVNNTKQYGATVILEGNSYDDAYQYACTLVEEKGYTLVHPFNDLDIATGQGTIAAEIYQELPDADIILVPIGGGGLAAGVSTLAKMLNPAVRVIGVEPKGAAAMYLSLQKGRLIGLDTVDTIADGVAVKRPGEKIFPYVQKNLDSIILVDDREIPAVFLDMAENHKIIVETAGLLTVAALRHLGVKGKKVVSVLSGGNIDVIGMSVLVQHGLINRDRVFTFSLLLPDRPGALERVAHIIAEQKGNIIRMEHNQLVHINRNAAVALEITLEAFGTTHKKEILEACNAAGYSSVLVAPGPLW